VEYAPGRAVLYCLTISSLAWVVELVPREDGKADNKNEAAGNFGNGGEM
jgi:hypothetical protein